MSIDPNNLAATAHVTFDDEFNSLSLWNGVSGIWSTTFWYQDALSSSGASLTSNGEQEWYINSNYAPTSGVTPWTVASGVLTLTAAPATWLVQSLINGYSYTSGEINSYHSFSQTYGLFEMRAELPTGQGFWPAFWLLPESGAWPPELDIMEVLTNNTTELYTTAHTEETGTHTMFQGATTVADMASGYHTYAVDWEPNTITWYFDNQEVYQIATPTDMNSPMYMIINLAAGGYWPGSTDGTSSAQMKIDYVRVFASGEDATGATQALLASDSSATQAVTSLTTSDSQVTLAEGITSVTLTGTAQTVVGNNDGDTFHSNDTANTLIGGTGNDTFYVGRAGDIITGGGGNDTYIFNANPWWGGHITDFNAGDVIDLGPELANASYSGSNPVADGYVKIGSDAAGDAQIYLDPNPAQNEGWWLAVTLDGVSASSLVWSGDDLVIGNSSSSGTTTTSSGSSISTGSTTSTGGSSSSTTTTASAVSTAAGTYTAASGVTDITLTGSAQTVTGNNAGDTFHSNDTGNTLIGGTGADTFYVGRGGDIITGGGGHDTYVFDANPWWGGHITDFNASDVIDFTPTMTAASYTGSDPVGAGYMKIGSDAAGDAQIYLDPNGTSGAADGWWLAVTLDGVSASSLQVSGDEIVIVSSSGATSSGSTPSTGGSSSTSTTTSSSAISTAAGTYAAPSGVTDITLTGHAQTVTGNNAGDTFHSNDTGNTLIGGNGADTFYVGRGGDIITGGGGHDTYVFDANPWWGGHITDFNASDVIDFTPTMTAASYTGSDPVGAGYMKIGSDAAGDAQIYLDPNGTSGAADGWWLAVTLDGVSASSLHVSGDQVTETGSSSETTSSTTVQPIVSTAAGTYTAAAGVTDITLTGSAQTVTGNNAGDTFHSNDTGNTLIGGTGNDTFYVGRGGDIITGGGGSDTYIFNANPWWGGHITDFNAGDTLNFNPTLQAASFTGSDPVASGYMKIVNDAAGEAQIYLDPNGTSGAADGWWLAVTLDHVASSTLHVDHGLITG